MSRFQSTAESGLSFFDPLVSEGLFRARSLTRNQVLLAILVVSFVLRVVGAIWFRGIIDGEGAEYARIAQNLIDGFGYVGIAAEGPQVVFPPLFPYLIATLSLVTGEAEVAGRTISVVAGSLVVIPVYLIARRLYGPRVAILAAALTGIHPFLVQISSTVHCEPTYLTLILTAIYMALRAMDDPTPRNLLAMGMLFGLGYLVRQEAFVYAIIGSAIVGLQIWRKDSQPKAAHLAALSLVALGFVLFPAPYVAWLSVKTGEFRLQAKSPVNVATESRIQQGLSPDEAAFSVSSDLEPTGTWMQPSLTIVRDFKIGTVELVKVLCKRAKELLYDGSMVEFGSPYLFALAVIGLFSRPWTLRLLLAHAYIIAILALVPVALLFTYVLGPRFYILYIPFLCMWAVLGIMALSRWARNSADACHVAPRYFPTIAMTAKIVAVLSIILPSTVFAAMSLRQASAERPFRQAVVNLSAGQTAPMRIADTATLAAFHARANFVWLPYSDEDTALRYLAKAGVTHVVLRSDQVVRPYLKKWNEEGIPNARKLVDIASATGVRFKVYLLER